MQEILNPLYLTFPVLERLPVARNRRYKEAVDHMVKVLEGFLSDNFSKMKLPPAERFWCWMRMMMMMMMMMIAVIVVIPIAILSVTIVN